MTDQRWNFGAIEQASAELDAEAAATKATLDKQRAQLPLVGDCWGGTGSDAWLAQQTRWQQKADDVSASLDRLCAAVDVAASHMQGVESTVGEMFS
ncbi:WXG100 family type VII secretion target [Mycobacterium hodleri]|uniref:WXG100 family type VII secretion target n=1 Tax=Mycolicibacterium hodleri TaxID=49897 RepID=UPI0021F30E31|nr:WXG100 family type VII secretion target [Mycolicibacterium hodleri]MCV7133447.1 WXG100 family type VII secretion target [Mycolicibacterium hodleri]